MPADVDRLIRSLDKTAKFIERLRENIKQKQARLAEARATGLSDKGQGWIKGYIEADERKLMDAMRRQDHIRAELSAAQERDLDQGGAA